MKKIIYALILPLVVVGGLVFANREMKNETAKKPAPRPLTAAEIQAERKKWEASPGGVQFKQWEASPAGKKVYAGIANIRKEINAFTNMKAVITSLSLSPGSRLGFGVMARINGDDYIVTFDANESQLEQLQSLKVNDKIIIRSHYISLAPKYAYPIIRGEEIEQDGKVIFKRIPPKGGC
jgi:hypothetical protein